MHARTLPCPRCALALLVIGLAVLSGAGPAWAQRPPESLKSLTISLWPEYDRPQVLCVYRGQLPDGAALPARVSFRLPATARGPSSAAAVDSAGTPIPVPALQAEEAGGTVTRFDLTWPRFQMEYYDDALRTSGASRELSFVYRADYPVEQLVLEMQEPYGAANFVLAPPADARSETEQGLVLHRRVVGPVAPGQEVRWQVTYAKSDPRPSAEALGLAHAQPGYGQAPPLRAAPRAPGEPATWVLVALLGAGSILGVALLLRASAGRPAPAAASVDGHRHLPGPPRPPRVRLARYCHQCGAPQSRGSVYCRRCGTRRRGT